MTPKKRPSAVRTPVQSSRRLPVPPWVAAACAYVLIAAALTWPLIVRLGSSVYGPYDHISTDLFSSINTYFWLLKHEILEMHGSALDTDMFAAPFGSPVNLVNFTGYVHLPLTALFGAVASRNIAILFNLAVSGIGMYALVRHLTGSAVSAFIAGIVFAFSPNMLVRSYTTFDSTQVQWLPLYTLYVLKFMEDRTWRSVLLAGAFLICNIMLAMPYFFIFLPVHTLTLLLARAGWEVWGKRRGFGEILRSLISPEAIRAWLRVGIVVFGVFVIFLAYYTVIVGGNKYAETISEHYTEAELVNQALAPTDYFMPHPRSTLLKGNVKETYWNTARPGKDPDSFVAYIGYLALGLAAAGLFMGRGRHRWMFLAVIVVALWATLGPTLLGLPTPSGIIYRLYAPFARRILLYKVFVQFGIAVLAGIGLARILEHIASPAARYGLTGALAAGILLEYAIVPPALSVDLTRTPQLYEEIAALPGDTVLLEVPVRRNNGNYYQGYAYYQMHHGRPLVNPYFGFGHVPDHIRPFYEQIKVPIEAQSYANLAALRWLGVTHLTYHWLIATETVIFRSWSAPGFGVLTSDTFMPRHIEGLNRIYTADVFPGRDHLTGPHDYDYGNLYEITAEPSPVALVFDYSSPYDPVPGVLATDAPTMFGWASALLDSTGTFYFPVADEGRLIRLLRQGGAVTAVNLSAEPVRFDVTFFAASGDSGRVIEARWNDTPSGAFTIGPEPSRCTVEGLALDADSTGELTLWSTRPAYLKEVELGVGRPVPLNVSAELWDFRVSAK